jgi:eukaryotic-like serine/threonine-protein kinase
MKSSRRWERRAWARCFGPETLASTGSSLKILSEESAADPDRRERFEQEARVISTLDHPHICPLYDVGDHDGVYFLVMPCLEGQTLADRLAAKPGAHQPVAQRIEDVLKIATEIAQALDAAHRRGIVHRDLKPGNIMLTRSGSKLLDFGLAKLRQRPGPLTATELEQTATAEGTLLGTMPYMSPEQVEGREADAR